MKLDLTVNQALFIHSALASKARSYARGYFLQCSEKTAKNNAIAAEMYKTLADELLRQINAELAKEEEK